MMKKAILVVSVGVLSMVSGCGTHSPENAPNAAQSTVQAASTKPAPAPDQTADAAAPSQGQAVAAGAVPQSTAGSAPESDPLDGAEVRVAESHVSPDGIRVIVARNETTGEAVFFACKTVMYGGLIDHTCPQPRLRITYTLEPLAGSSVSYWAGREIGGGESCGKDGGFASLENAARFPLSHSHDGGDRSLSGEIVTQQNQFGTEGNVV